MAAPATGRGSRPARPTGPPTAAGRAEGDDPLVVGRARPEGDVEGVGPEDGLGGIPPLHQGHGPVLHQLPEAEVDDLLEVVQAPDVGVQERAHRTVRVGRILANQGEGGAGDRLGHPEAGPEPLGERRLASPEIAGQQEDVAGDAPSGHHGGQRPGLVGGVGVQDERERRGHDDHPRSCLARMRSARISATTAPPERRAAAGW